MDYNNYHDELSIYKPYSLVVTSKDKLRIKSLNRYNSNSRMQQIKLTHGNTDLGYPEDGISQEMMTVTSLLSL